MVSKPLIVLGTATLTTTLYLCADTIKDYILEVLNLKVSPELAPAMTAEETEEVLIALHEQIITKVKMLEAQLAQIDAQFRAQGQMMDMEQVNSFIFVLKVLFCFFQL